MILKKTKVTLADTINKGWATVIHTYGGFFRKYTSLGQYVKITIRNIVRKTKRRGKKIKRIRIGQIYRGLIIRTRRKLRHKDTTTVFFFKNDILMIRRKGVFKSTLIRGPSSRCLKKKKLKFLFKKII